MIEIPGMTDIPEPGIYEKVPDEEYRSWYALSYSMIKPLLRSPMHLKRYLELSNEQTTSMLLGSVVDCMLLEPEAFDSRYFVLPETYIDSKGSEKPFTLHSKTCRSMVGEAADRGLTSLTCALKRNADEIVAAVQTHRTVWPMISGSKKQVSIVWDDTETNVRMKGRIDALAMDRPMDEDDAVIDVKTCRDASAQAFSRLMFAYNYHVQAAMYADAVENITTIRLPFHNIAIETSPPYGIGIYTPRAETHATGRFVYRKAATIWQTHIEGETWPGYSEFPEEIQIPQWAIDRALDEGVYNE